MLYESVATFNALISSMNRTDGVIKFATNCKWWFRIEPHRGLVEHRQEHDWYSR